MSETKQVCECGTPRVMECRAERLAAKSGNGEQAKTTEIHFDQPVHQDMLRGVAAGLLQSFQQNKVSPQMLAQALAVMMLAQANGVVRPKATGITAPGLVLPTNFNPRGN